MMATAQNKSFSFRVKTELLRLGLSVTSLANRVGYKRNTVSLAIHRRDRMPNVKAAIRKELGLK